MITAIASRTNTPRSTIDPQFGRASYFCLYDSDTDISEFITNPYKESLSGSGKDLVKFLIEKKVKRVVTSEIGVKARTLLEKDKIEIIMVFDENQTVSKILKALKDRA